ncbi:helix-turn-helix domain-containing protein [Snuella sedimenti]|uniref:Helix-turn-helix transcriptional regulator n=1 Tax=Snuella sedimenti TaxID=2798802 RepID=A0A8J7J904_9FLAO|nr:AraC family transcriptional regulator [Snuella sedimenti]MBJ6366544.1 helix-turn-helix transcriptional regulator [Snuella sedimenti]
MKEAYTEIAVKNMVCNRCIKVVREELTKNHFDFNHVALGTIYFDHGISEKEKAQLKTILEAEGFELVEDKEAVIVKNIKTLIIQLIHHGKEKPEHQTFSGFIASEIGMEYTQLSKLFSEIAGHTIEHYIIEQRIERAKELLIYNELTLSQISYELNYSSPQHLSRQFKQITGLTPSAFKKIRIRKKLDTI